MIENAGAVGRANDAHFLRAVTDMAERTNVVTGDAIYTEKGMKLVDKGTRVDSRLYDRLVMHKLRDPIDSSLVADNLVDTASLLTLARQQCVQVELLRRMVTG